MLLSRLLNHLIRVDGMTLIDAYGRSHSFGNADGPGLIIRLHDPSLHWKMYLRPDLTLGEALTDGTLTVENGSVRDLMMLMGRNLQGADPHLVMRVVARMDRLFQRLQQLNPENRAQENVAHHYDLSGDFYALFLDSDLQYSCAYFTHPDEDLETAQENKKRHIAAKLLLEPGQKVLDIGSGWGGLALYLAENWDVDVTGLTLSVEQHKIAQARAQQAGLAERVRFLVRDYRAVGGSYDRIVSVGMFEHVGINHFATFFSKVRKLLTEDGVALIHTIGHADGPGITDPWIRKYIFPGGYIPALSEIMPEIENARLIATDIEVLRRHYAETLRHWMKRFQANWSRIAELYDERFCRMWEYYLAVSEMSFEHMDSVVFQIQMARDQEAVPLTRDYVPDREAAEAQSASETQAA